MDSNTENNIQIKVDLYLSGSMSESERLLFEKKMELDDDLKETVSLQKSIGNVLFNEEWMPIDEKLNTEEIADIKKTLQSEEYQKNFHNIKHVSNLYSKAIQKKTLRKRLTYFSAAAVVSLILASVFLFPKQESLDSLYTEYENWEELTSYIEQGKDREDFSQGEILYRERKFKEAIVIFEKYINGHDNSLYSAGLIYLGASYFGEKNYKKAIETFDILANSASYDSSKAYWYKLLIYLKQKDRVNIQNTIQTILSNQNNYNYAEALKINEIVE